jgi:hypothetical protein
MPDNINQFLNNNQRKSNQNPKFVDSSPTSSVFRRLEYNFTPSDPSILELSDDVKEHLARMPKLLRDWQAEDMRTGTVNRLNYYKNPVGDISKSIQNTTGAIKDAIPISEGFDFESGTTIRAFLVPELQPIYDEAEIVFAECQKFIDHTDRLSNVVEIKPDVSELPHYEQAMAVGRQLLYIVYQTDSIQNNSPILGTFTSLFIVDELSENNDVITPYPALIANSIVVTTSGVGGDGGETTTYSTSLTSEQIETIVNDLKATRALTETRRRHDEKFWRNAQTIVDEYQQLKSMSGGETQQKLIDNYVGTDELLEKLTIKDVPVEPTYNINMAFDGTITFTPRLANTNTIVIPTIVVRTVPIDGAIDYYEELPLTGNIVGDNYYVTSTGETWRWNGSSWILISKQDPVSPTLSLDDYIDFYSNNSLNVAFSGYQLRLTPAAIKFDTDNGIWSPNATIQILNTGTKEYIYPVVSVSNFLNAEIRYTFNPESTGNVLGVGNTVTFNVSARSLSEGNTTDYGVITIVPGLRIQTKLVSQEASFGVLLPSEISYNIASANSRAPINVQSGPYPILSPSSEAPDLWTWKNLSVDPVTISSLENITEANSANDMTITFYQANTPNTLNVNDSVLWYANVTPFIEFPNTQTFLISTTDGQQRIMKLGIDPGNVDDSNLYNEVVNSNPDIVVTNSAFDLRIFGGKPNTLVTVSGPTSSAIRLLPANGNLIIANNIIEANGSYTYVFDFNGTNHRRTLTKAIFT